MTSSFCPVCNGLNQWSPQCGFCGNTAQDMGKLQDYYGPYSAYRPIDDMKQLNGYPDLQNHECIHLIFCEHCQQTTNIGVSEVNLF